jgi:hypothetical protein
LLGVRDGLDSCLVLMSDVFDDGFSICIGLCFTMSFCKGQVEKKKIENKQHYTKASIVGAMQSPRNPNKS